MSRCLAVVTALLGLWSATPGHAATPVVCEPLPPPAAGDYTGPLFPFVTKVTSGLPELTTEMGKMVGYSEGELHRWGYMSVDGKTIVQPTFHHAWPFSGDRAVVQVLVRKETATSVKVIQTFGVIDRTGAFNAAPRFNRIEQFSEGLARAILPSPFPRDAKDATIYRGYIDPTGSMRIAMEFGKRAEYAGDFSAGLAWFHPSISMTQARRWLTSKELKILEQFGMGAEDSVVRSPSTPKGYIDRTGGVAIAPRFKAAAPFRGGMAAVQSYTGDKWGFITPKGTWAIEPRFEWARSFAQGRAAVSVNQKKCGYIDAKGKWVTKASYDRCGTFSEGFAVVHASGRPQVIDLAGTPAGLLDRLPGGDMAAVGVMTGGLLPVAKVVDGKKKWGFVDTSGAMVIPYTYTDYAPPEFSDGLALVTIDVREPSTEAWNEGQIVDVHKRGYIDRAGKWIYGPLAGPWDSW
jgi:hypothetical protein